MEENQVQPRTALAVFIILAGTSVMASATPVHLRCEYRQNPLGIDAAEPHLSWQSDNSQRNWNQAAYQVLVASSLDSLRAGHPDVWDSGKTDSDESVGIAFKGPSLESRKRYYWAVRVWDTSSVDSDIWPEVSQTRTARCLNRPRRPGGKWACCIRPTGTPVGSIGRIPKTKRTGQAFAGSGLPGKMRLLWSRKKS